MNANPVIIGKAVRAERLRQKLSLDGLARRSDVSKGMLSTVENGNTNPSLALLHRIAVGLQTDLTKLLGSHRRALPVWRVIRADDEYHVFSRTKSCKLRTLSPLDLEKQIEFYELTLAPQGRLVSEPHFRGAEEILTVAHGHLQVRSGEREVEIRRGDSVHYAADVPHAIHNLGRGEAVAFMIVRWFH